MHLISYLLLAFYFRSLQAQYPSKPGDFLEGGDPNCGKVDEVSWDARTKAPWMANIFIKAGGQWVTFNSGVIVSPTAILAVFGGAFGAPNKSGRYQIFPPRKFLIGLGLKTTQMDDYDQYTQFFKVKYIEPNMKRSEVNKEFHMFVFHLDGMINFTTPYVRPICLLDRKASVAFHGFYAVDLYAVDLKLFDDVINDIYHFAGYTTKPSGSHTQIQVHSVEPPNKQFCDDEYSKRYRVQGNGSEQLCGRLKFNDDPFQDGECLRHGSSVFMLQEGQRYLTGLTAVTPSTRVGCGKDSLYFVAAIWHYIDWLYRSLKCSPNASCADGTCIVPEKICNSVADCPDRSDENQMYCDATNYCPDPKRTRPLHYNSPKCQDVI